MLTKHGNHVNAHLIATDGDVDRFFEANGRRFEDVVRDARDGGLVPHVENLIGPTFHILTEGDGAVGVSRHDNVTGQDTFIMSGPGTATIDGYWSIFESSQDALDRAIKRSSQVDLLVAATQGVASIEHYLRRRVEVWNSANPTDQLVDSFQSKVSFDDKIDDWLPKMTGGTKLQKGTGEWAEFKRIRAIRDNSNVHPKGASLGVSYRDLAEQINLFRTGIAGLLIRLHLLFDDPIPRIIIRARYAPEVEVTGSTDGG